MQPSKSRRSALFYLTYNGLYNFTNGIGTQTLLLLSGLESLMDTLAAQYGPIDLHLICPQPDSQTWGYDPEFYTTQKRRIEALGGSIHLIPYKTMPTQDLWEIRSWNTLSERVVPLLLDLTATYDRSLVICIDQPWLHTPLALRSLATPSAAAIDLLLVLYNTAIIRNRDAPDPTEQAWEQKGLEMATQGSRACIADVCPSFTQHLHTHFHLPAAQFAPYTSSILVNDPMFARQPESTLRATLQHYGVPLDRPIALAFGRAAPIKGFDTIIPALAPLRDHVHFVLISVPYLNDDTEQQRYDRLIEQHRVSATHIKAFTRDLPCALSQWPNTKIVLVPSRHETFSNIPLEVALWAREHGPVVVTSTAGGFQDQIQPGQTGFFLDTDSLPAMTNTLRHVLELSDHAHAAIRHQAYRQVVELYDFLPNFQTTLRWFWPH